AVLSSTLVMGMVFDPTGFIWVGTDAGVFRYDGHGLVPLNALVRGAEQLPAVEITALVGDATGKVWCGTTVGLFCFEPTTGKLRRIRLPHQPSEGLKVWRLWPRPRRACGERLSSGAPERVTHLLSYFSALGFNLPDGAVAARSPA
ncbi:MAG: hypothetical protein H7330_06480, partial [Hymenobacteraceae bacterium]|nr:hypothetical protein [Hymenobacteraceae bacterium]